MEFHFYTMDFFFSFTRSFLYTFRKINYNYLFHAVFVFPEQWMQKSRNSRGKTRAMEFHFYTMDFFFLSFTRSFLYTFRKIPYIYLFHAVFVFPEQWMQKISKFEGKTRGMESHFYNMVFFFLSREFSYILKEYIHVEVCFSKNGDTYSPNYKRTTEQ